MLVFSNKCGQLGNRLFAFAHLIAVARRHNLKVINLSFDEYSKYFSTTSKDVWCRYPARESIAHSDRMRSFLFLSNRILLKLLRAIKLERTPFHTIVIADLPEYSFKGTRFYELDHEGFVKVARRKPFVFMFGRFFRDYYNLEKFQHEIKAYFSLIPSLQADVDAFISGAKHGCNLLIGVHIRRGDYEFFVDGKYFYSQKDYYRLLVQIVATAPGMKIRFLLSSNEEIDLSIFNGLDIIKAPGHLVKDLYCLSQCDYILGPPSTFSKWAAFYGSKPLYHIQSLDDNVGLESFKMFSPEVLFNFSFN